MLSHRRSGAGDMVTVAVVSTAAFTEVFLCRLFYGSVEVSKKRKKSANVVVVVFFGFNKNSLASKHIITLSLRKTSVTLPALLLLKYR